MIDFSGLELIQFHDLPLNSIRVHSGPEAKLEIEISVFNEALSEYQATTLIFGDLTQLNPPELSIENFEEAEIYSFDYHLNGELFHGKLSCLLGFGKPSLELDFACKKVAIIENHA